MIQRWTTLPNPPDLKEQARRTVDLFVVSVLLDAGAGNSWKYKESITGSTFSRSEGLGVASLHMFESGLFSSKSEQPYQVDGERQFFTSHFSFGYVSQFIALAAGLRKITPEMVASAMQVSDANPMVGVEGRSSLLFNLSKALEANPSFFGADGRPGNVIG